MSNTNEILPHKSSHAIIVDYDQELQALWREHLASTPSTVLCENCNHHEEEWWKKPDIKVRIHTARVYTTKKFCECPDSEVGKIKIDPERHLPSCRYHKPVKTTTLTIPTKISDGYSLGVAL